MSPQSGQEAPAAPHEARVPLGRGELAALTAILVLAGVLRVVALGAGLWFDEIETLVRYVRMPLPHIVTTFDSQNQHLLYSVLARVSVTALGDGAWALRLPAVLFGVASLWAVWYFARSVASVTEALLAALLLAVSYHHVWFSQNARGYTMLMCFTLVGSRIFLDLLRSGAATGRKQVMAYAVTMGLALYTHLTALFVIAAHGLVWAWWAWRTRARVGGGARWAPFGALAGCGAVAVLLYLPVLPSLAGTAGAPTMPGVAVAWRSPLWFVSEALQGLVRGLPGGWLALGFAALVGLAGVWSWWRRSPWTVAVMLVPVAVTAAALLATAHNLWPRFFFFAAGFAVLIVLRGGFALAAIVPGYGTRLATGVFLLGALGSLATLPRAWQPKQDFEGARTWLLQQAASDDAVFVVDMTRFPYADYLRTRWRAAVTVDDLVAAEATHRRTWVVYTFPARLSVVQPAIWERLQREYQVAREFPGTVGGGAVVVMKRGGA